MMIRFIELAATVLLAVWVATRVLAPLFIRKKRDSELDEERAERRKEDAERRLHAARVEGEARRIEKAAERVRSTEDEAAPENKEPKETVKVEEGKQADGT